MDATEINALFYDKNETILWLYVTVILGHLQSEMNRKQEAKNSSFLDT